MTKDIEIRILQDFSNPKDAVAVNEIFSKIVEFGSNTGIAQVLRSILYLADGNVQEVNRYYLMYCEDPRDVIGEAEMKAGNPGHWFGIPFDEMEDFSGGLPGIKTDEGDNLPF